VTGGLHEESKQAVELYDVAGNRVIQLPRLKAGRFGHSIVTIKNLKTMTKCYVFSEDSIEYLDVDPGWKL